MSSNNKGAPLVLGGEPRATLLPPEVHLRAKARANRRFLGFLVALAVLIAAGAYGAAFLFAEQAESQLASARAETEALLAEQLRYSEATRVANLVKMSESAQLAAVANEIDWDALIDEIRLKLLEGTGIDSATMTTRVPFGQDGDASLAEPGPLSAPRVATVSLVLRSTSLLDSTALVRQLADLPGFVDATPGSVEREDTEFVTTITLNLNEDALRNRFGTETEADS